MSIQCPEEHRCVITVTGITVIGLILTGVASIFVNGGLEVTKLISAGLIGFLARDGMGGKDEKSA